MGFAEAGEWAWRSGDALNRKPDARRAAHRRKILQRLPVCVWTRDDVLWDAFGRRDTIVGHGGPISVKTLVLGVGNSLLADEGAGVHAVRHLETRCGRREDVELVDAGTLSFTLAGAIDDCGALIVIDAAELKEAPGTVRLFESEAMDRFLARNRKLSVHEVSLLDLLSMARLAGRLPARRALIGIQPGRIDWGERPSPPVAAALPAAGDLALSLIDRWNAHEAR